MQNLQVSSAFPGTKCYQVTYPNLCLTIQPSACEHIATIVNGPLLCWSSIAEESQLLGNVREIQWNQSSYIYDSVSKVVTVIKHKETAGE
jgi:hypothetical protein